MTETVIQKKRGRPPKNATRAHQRPRRIPVSGRRDILTVGNREPDFVYRWVKDYHETGGRIQQFIDAGYDFVKPEDHQIGETYVFRSEDVGGSITRRPDGKTGEYLYLMRINRDWYDEDQEAKQRMVDEQDARAFRPDGYEDEAPGSPEHGLGQYDAGTQVDSSSRVFQRKD